MLVAALFALPAAASAAENEAPRCADVTMAVAPDRSRPVSLPCFDDAQTQMTFKLGAAAHGDFRRAQVGGWRYTPDPGATGTDTVTFTASDGKLESEPATLEIVHTTANLAPQCHPQRVTAVNGSAYLHALACTDPNQGDALLVSAATNPAHGVVRSTGGPLTYQAAQGYFGADGFTIQATDGQATSPAADVDVDVVPLSAPVCEDRGTTPVRTDTPKQIRLLCSDNSSSGGHFFNRTIVTQAQHGDLVVDMFGLRYEPDPGYEGPDQAVIKLSNGYSGNGSGGESEPLTLRFAVSDNANEPPECFPAYPGVGRADKPIQFGIPCNDPDGDALTPVIVNDVDGGAATFGSGQFGPTATYTADATFSGSDTLVYRMSDGKATSTTITQHFQVAGVNENTAPTCFPGAGLQVRQGRAHSVTMHCWDDEGDPIASYARTQPQHGTAAAPQTMHGTTWISYTPPSIESGYVGLDRFTYTATDNRGATSAPASALFDVRAPAPLQCAALPDRSIRTDQPLYASMWCGADDGAPPPNLTVHVEPEHGDVTVYGYGSFEYEPDDGFEGTDTFTIRASSGTEVVDRTQKVTVSDEHNTKPTCHGDYNAITREEPIELDLSCYDAEHDPITITVVDPPVDGTLGAFDGSRVTYTPKAGFIGTDTFSVRPNDGRVDGDVAEQEVAVRSASSNVRPTCHGFTTFTSVGQQAMISPSCHDADGDDLTMSITDGPDHGTVLWDAGWRVWRYTPEAGFEGWDQLTFTAGDGRESSLPTTVTVQVGNPTRAPVCDDMAANVEAGEPRRLQLPCRASFMRRRTAGETLVYEIVEGPKHGTLSAVEATGHVTYTPAAGYSGEDTFRYRALVGSTPSAVASARLGVNVRLSTGGGGTGAPQGTATSDSAPPPAQPKPPLPPNPNDPFTRLGGRVVPAPGVSLGSARAFVGAGTPVQGLRMSRTGGIDVMAILCSQTCVVTVEPSLELPSGGKARGAAARKAFRLRRQRLSLAVGRPGLVAVKVPSALRKRIARTPGARLKVAITVRDARRKVTRDTARFRLRAR